MRQLVLRTKSGKTPDGEYYFASSVADGGTVLWMMEKLRLKLFEVE